MKLIKLFATFCVGLFITTLLALPLQAGSHSKKLKIALLPGVVDPFYFTMHRGAKHAAEGLGVELMFQIPKKWNPSEKKSRLSKI